MGAYQLDCFFTSTSQCKKMNKKIAEDIEINIHEGVPAILLMIKYFLRNRPNNNDDKPFAHFLHFVKPKRYDTHNFMERKLLVGVCCWFIGVSLGQDIFIRTKKYVCRIF